VSASKPATARSNRRPGEPGLYRQLDDQHPRITLLIETAFLFVDEGDEVQDAVMAPPPNLVTRWGSASDGEAGLTGKPPWHTQDRVSA
jgi:hypothetical protein